MNLTAMSLRDLYRLRDDLQHLVAAVIALRCLKPAEHQDPGDDDARVLVNLTPGQGAQITLCWGMPQAHPVDAPPSLPPEALLPEVLPPEAMRLSKGAAVADTPYLLDPGPVLIENIVLTESPDAATGGSISDAPDASAADFDAPGGDHPVRPVGHALAAQLDATPDPEPAPMTSAPAPGGRGTNALRWTDDDDQALINAVVACVAAGRPKVVAFRRIADERSRGFDAVKRRATVECKDRIAAAVAALPAPPAAPASRSAPRPVQVAEGITLGPLSDAEKATALRLAGDGLSTGDIAARLNSRIQTVALYLNKFGRQEQAAASDSAPPPSARTVEKIDMASDAIQPRSVPSPPAPAPTPAVAPPVPEFGASLGLTLRQRNIDSHLSTLRPDGWSASDDLDLVHSLATGSSLAETALNIGRDAAVVKVRFRALSAVIRDDRDRLTIDGQQDLLVVLRRRVMTLNPGLSLTDNPDVAVGF